MITPLELHPLICTIVSGTTVYHMWREVLTSSTEEGEHIDNIVEVLIF